MCALSLSAYQNAKIPQEGNVPLWWWVRLSLHRFRGVIRSLPSRPARWRWLAEHHFSPHSELLSQYKHRQNHGMHQRTPKENLKTPENKEHWQRTKKNTEQTLHQSFLDVDNDERHWEIICNISWLSSGLPCPWPIRRGSQTSCCKEGNALVECTQLRCIWMQMRCDHETDSWSQQPNL